MSDQWYVLSEGEQLGPYPSEQLVQFAQEGRISAETMVWADGMEAWVTASDVQGLFPEAPVAVVAQPVAVQPVTAAAWAPPGARPVTATAPMSASPYTAPASSLVPTAPVGGEYPYFSVKPASFSLWMWTFVGGILCVVLMIVFFIMAAKTSMEAQTNEALQSQVLTQTMLGMCMLVLSALCLLVWSIFTYINLYRAWYCLRAGGPRTTPGKAIGMMFVPFYNLYWIFVAIAGLPKDWNRIVASYDDTQTAPRFSENVFLMYCIGSLAIPPLALVVMFPMMSQLCNGINFFAYRRNPKTISPAAAAGFGGIRFG